MAQLGFVSRAQADAARAVPMRQPARAHHRGVRAVRGRDGPPGDGGALRRRRAQQRLPRHHHHRPGPCRPRPTRRSWTACGLRPPPRLAQADPAGADPGRGGCRRHRQAAAQRAGAGRAAARRGHRQRGWRPAGGARRRLRTFAARRGDQLDREGGGGAGGTRRRGPSGGWTPRPPVPNRTGCSTRSRGRKPRWCRSTRTTAHCAPSSAATATPARSSTAPPRPGASS